MTLAIEANVPLPAESDYVELKRAFKAMKPGQSVVFTGTHSYIHALAGEAGIRVKVRAIQGTIAIRGAKEYRIWRII